VLWTTYEKTAVLDMETIDLLFENDQRDGFMRHKRVLLKAMEQFGLIAHQICERTNKVSENF